MSQSLERDTDWNLSTRFLFRFFAIYFLLYIFPFPLGNIPVVSGIESLYDMLWHALIPWVGNHVLHLKEPITVFPAGSGDTTYNYVQILVFVVLSFIGAIIWSVLDRKKNEYIRLFDILWTYVRYYLCFTMMIYGFYKVFKSQFPFPYHHMFSTYSESSPMGLLWSFMGYSVGFNTFTGLAEIIGGVLLLFRKTTTLGALICVTVVSNIVAMNLAFDVPVKLFSMHLLLMSLFLALPAMRRLIDFFILNRAVGPAKLAIALPKRWMRITRLILKPLLIVGISLSVLPGIWQGYKTYGDEAREKQRYFGFYQVENYVVNGDTIPPLATDTSRWKMMSMIWDGSTTVKLMNDSVKFYNFKADTSRMTVKMKFSGNDSDSSLFKYRTPNDSTLILDGRMNRDSVYISMRRLDHRKFRLISRGFHWVNEYPYNR